MHNNSFTTETILHILKLYKNQIIAFVCIATILGAIATFVLPKYYASTSTIVPANPKVTDKNYIYNNQVLDLNSAYGTEEDLDRTLTTLRLSSNFSLAVDSFKLINHYNIKNNHKAKAKAMLTLVTNSSIIKTDNGAIAIKVWDKDNNMAAALANAIVYFANNNLMQQNKTVNNNYLQSLQMELQNQIKTLDSLNNNNTTVALLQKKSLNNTIEQTTTSITQLKTSSSGSLQAILVLEKAYPSTIADKPRLKFWIPAAFFSSTIFGILVALVFYYRNKK
jgi:uncharacterized protein involved in exopolysaccharide biosynthesis